MKIFRKELNAVYNGLKEISLSNHEYEKFKKGEIDLDLLRNQYLIVNDEYGKLIEVLRFDGENFSVVDSKKRFKTGSTDKGIIPLNAEQQAWFDCLDNPNITVKTVMGQFGSGKTHNALYWSLSKINEGIFDRILYVRNNIEVKDSIPLGALPNGKNDKLEPFSSPISDILGDRGRYKDLVNTGRIELEHLGYIRGRTLDNTILFVSEAQNLTKDHVILLISRVGKNSVVIFDGDIRQTDKNVFVEKSGLVALVETLKGNELFGLVQLKNSVRSKTAKLCELFD